MGQQLVGHGFSLKRRLLNLIEAMFNRRNQSIDTGTGADPNDVRAALDAQVRAVTGQVPAEVMAKILSIRQTISGILPASGSLPPASPVWFVIERTATDYLPRSLENYLSLPRLYATRQPVRNGKTPKDLLLEQLTLLDDKMKEIAQDMHQHDADRLLANGRFLEDRFGRSGLSLRPPISDEKKTEPGL